MDQPAIKLITRDELMRQMLQDLFSTQNDFTFLPVQGPDELARWPKPNIILVDEDVTYPEIELPNLPIIVLGTRSQKNQARHERISKPFRISALIQHIRRKLQSTHLDLFLIGSIRFQPHFKTIVAQGRSIDLTEKEAAILNRLVRSPGYWASKEDLLNEVWGYQIGVTTHTVETHIYRLRQKMMNIDPTDAWLITESGGYKLNIIES